jgi:hypothetical protein
MNIPQRIILPVILLLAPVLLTAQTNIAANRVIIKDSLSINGTWIKRINNDSTLQFADGQSLSVDGALKKYIQHTAIATAIVSNRTDSALTLEAGGRTLAMTALSGGSLSDREIVDRVFFNKHGIEITVSQPATLDSLHLVVTSSDNISTPMVFGRLNNLWAYGKPPFSLQANIVNHTPHSAINFDLRSTNSYSERGGTTYYLNQKVYTGDTMNLDLHRLRGRMSLTFTLKDTINENPAVPDKIIRKYFNNRSGKFFLSIGATALPPGEKAIYKDRVFLSDDGTTTLSIEVRTMLVYLNGDYAYDWGPTTPYRITVLKNGGIYKTLTEQDTDFDLLIDNTWDDIEIILEDN